MDDTIKLRLRIPLEIYQDVLLDSTLNGCSLSEEIIRKLEYSLRHNTDVMLSDRLHRLIFEPRLAYSAKRYRKLLKSQAQYSNI